MYNWQFLEQEYGYDWVSKELPLYRTEHVTFDPVSNEVKIYLKSECGNFIYKLSQDQKIQRHLFYPSPDFQIDLDGLYALLSPTRRLLTLKFMAFDEGGQGYYFGVEDASRRDFKALFEGLVNYTGLSLETLIGYANRINGLNCQTVDELYREKAIFMLRLGARRAGCKFYATPMAWQNPFKLDPVSIDFLENLYALPVADLQNRMVSLAVSIEFDTERLLITTQDVVDG